MQYWILQHNPELLPGDVHSSGVPECRDYWHIRRRANEVHVDDMAFIWHAGVNRGIYDAAKVVSVPPHSLEFQSQIDRLTQADSSSWLDPAARDRLRQLPTILVDRQYGSGLEPPLLLEELTKSGFDSLPVILMPRSGIYRVEQVVGAQLLAYIRQTR